MDEILKDLGSLHWWFGVVVVGVIVGLAVEFVAPGLRGWIGRQFGKVSKRWAQRNEKAWREYSEQIELLARDAETRQSAKLEAIFRSLQFVALLGIAFCTLVIANVLLSSAVVEKAIEGASSVFWPVTATIALVLSALGMAIAFPGWIGVAVSWSRIMEAERRSEVVKTELRTLGAP